MGYYSDVALCLTKNGMDQLKTALAEAEKPPRQLCSNQNAHRWRTQQNR